VFNKYLSNQSVWFNLDEK
jgi:CRP-like cAMP-binding protein